MATTRKNWTEEETILAMDLYLRIPYGKINKSHPEIIKLSKLIGRTPDAVAFKMFNLAHFDPDQIARNVSGLKNASALDRRIAEQYFGDNNLIFDFADKIYEAHNIEHYFESEEIVLPEGYDKSQIVKARKGHKAFSDVVKAAYKERCCITGLSCRSMLVASHIKPWSESSETEKTNPRNGLCLNSFHDKAFDRGLITVKPDYSIVISSKLKKTNMDEITKDWILFYGDKKINLPEKYIPDAEFLKYHNDVVFIG